ncbi:hypothetical protein ACO22_01649 [Paracoccidioides brasiliensis]|uniref:Uncharacterized protein n=1 Tax=Paracoccidioides brasiliensis TaxID=121759 RepID=A0A1D2JLA1_PARBR|nr:hypothetical protein ACO22_01649 [Paracoccidioides brasiliensis]
MGCCGDPWIHRSQNSDKLTNPRRGQPDDGSNNIVTKRPRRATTAKSTILSASLLFLPALQLQGGRVGASRPDILNDTPKLPPISLSTTSSPISSSTVDQLDIFTAFENRSSRFTSNLHLDDLNFLHNYMTNTYLTLSNNAEHIEIWKTVIPKESLAHLLPNA